MSAFEKIGAGVIGSEIALEFAPCRFQTLHTLALASGRSIGRFARTDHSARSLSLSVNPFYGERLRPLPSRSVRNGRPI